MGSGEEGATLPVVGSGRKRKYKQGLARWTEEVSIQERRAAGPKVGGGEGEAQGVWTLNWPTFLVTMARKWVRTNAGKGSVCMYVCLGYLVVQQK